MGTLIGKICPFCQQVINEGDSVIVCPSCNIPHHESCWYAHGGCTTPDCLYQPQTTNESVPTSGFDLSDQLDEIDFAPGASGIGEQQPGGFDLSRGFMPTEYDPGFRSNETANGSSKNQNGTNKSITIMSFMENSVEENEMEYSKQREERIKLGKESLNVMKFTDENAAAQKPAETSNQQKAASLTKPKQQQQQSPQHKASLTKPNQNRTQPAQKQNIAQNTQGTKANLNKSQPRQQTKASLTKPNANAKPSLQKGGSPNQQPAAPKLTRNGKPVNDKRPEINPANFNKINPAAVKSGNTQSKSAANNTRKLCVKCNKLISADKDICPYCGADQTAAENPDLQPKITCPLCGSQFGANQKLCPKCGRKVTENQSGKKTGSGGSAVSSQADKSSSSAVNQFSAALEQSRRKTRTRMLFTGAATLMLVIAVLITMKATAKKDFNGMFSDLDNNPWCEISDDGMTMTIDTNPDDSPDYIETIAYSRIKEVNKKLGFTENVYRSMGNTKAADGERYSTFQKYMVKWTYHPDRGLEVVYTIQ